MSHRDVPRTTPWPGTISYSAGVHHLHGMLAAIGATALLVGTGVWLTAEPEADPAREPGYRPAALADHDTGSVALVRGPFCDLLADGAVEHAVDGDPGTPTTWTDGDELPDVGVVHEYGCRWTAGGGAEASAWVLSPPVTEQRADRLADAAGREGECRTRSDAPAYGAPSVALLCTAERSHRASYRGLFGDTWLTCTLALPSRVPERQLLERTGAWCVAVAEAAEY